MNQNNEHVRMSPAVATFMLKKLPKIIRYIDKDLGKMFSLTEPWELTLLKPLPGEFTCPEFTAKGRKIVFMYKSVPGNVACDGATMVPEEILGEPTVIGAIAHDPLYRNLRPFAKAMGWSCYKTRKFFDKIYGAILLELARRVEDPKKRKALFVNAYVQYFGVRLFGSIAHYAYQALGMLIAMAFLFLGGCGLDGVIEQDWKTPQYVQETNTTPVHHGPLFIVVTNAITGALREEAKQ